MTVPDPTASNTTHYATSHIILLLSKFVYTTTPAPMRTPLPPQPPPWRQFTPGDKGRDAVSATYECAEPLIIFLLITLNHRPASIHFVARRLPLNTRGVWVDWLETVNHQATPFTYILKWVNMGCVYVMKDALFELICSSMPWVSRFSSLVVSTLPPAAQIK